MQKITSILENSIFQSLNVYGNIDIVVAYSGGVDSQVLLYALAQLKQNKLISNAITVCHVNHGLSSNASAWQEFAKKECAKLSIKLVIKAVDIQAQAQQSLEELARDARYDALKSLTDKKSLVLTGHHSDDQSETFLLALKRGAGLKGLSSMKIESQLAQHLLIRPLLNTSRQEIVSYAKEHQLNWIEDESNTDTSFDRNFIRQTIMPLMLDRWPSISKTINRSASHCLAGQELLDELAEQDLKQALNHGLKQELKQGKASDECLNIDCLASLSSARFNNLIRYFLAQHYCVMPSTEQIKQLKFQLQASDEKTPMVKVGRHYLRRYKSALYLTTDFEDISSWQGQVDLGKEHSELVLPDNLGQLIFNRNSSLNISQNNSITTFSLPKNKQQVAVRFSHDNPKCLPDFRQHSRNVKKILQELNIAPWQRKRIPFLYYDNELVAAIGYFVCKPFIPMNNLSGISIDWKK